MIIVEFTEQDLKAMVNFYQPKSELENHRGTIEQYFRDNPVARTAEDVVKIEALTGIRRSKNQVREFLKKDRHAVSQSGGDTGRCRPRRASRL